MTLCKQQSACVSHTPLDFNRITAKIEFKVELRTLFYWELSGMSAEWEQSRQDGVWRGEGEKNNNDRNGKWKQKIDRVWFTDNKHRLFESLKTKQKHWHKCVKGESQ